MPDESIPSEPRTGERPSADELFSQTMETSRFVANKIAQGITVYLAITGFSVSVSVANALRGTELKVVGGLNLTITLCFLFYVIVMFHMLGFGMRILRELLDKETAAFFIMRDRWRIASAVVLYALIVLMAALWIAVLHRGGFGAIAQIPGISAQ